MKPLHTFTSALEPELQATSKQEEKTAALLPPEIVRQNGNIIDLLRTAPCTISFAERVRNLQLSSRLEHKILQKQFTETASTESDYLLETEEKELATEVLLLRHKFTCLVAENRLFRQAAITIIQNIYLFQHRKIFFEAAGKTGEQERQEALMLFSKPVDTVSIPLSKTFQHMILARIWDRIINQASDTFLESRPFRELHAIVEQLNTIRNIYIIFSMGLVGKLTRQISPIYRQSITHEDACQIGSFGIARAAYRYHPSMGNRFSTYAARWIQKEIQRQALEGRLIRISTNLVEQLSRTARNGDIEQNRHTFDTLLKRTAQVGCSLAESDQGQPYTAHAPHAVFERKNIAEKLLLAIEALPEKSKDIILRRYGLGKYMGKEQSVIEISTDYGVTRSSIYQLEQTALRKLKTLLAIDPASKS